MAKKGGGNVLGSWAFLIGVILAVVLGLGFVGGLTGTWLLVLVVIGLIVGLLNIADREVKPFLLSGIVLIIATSMGQSVIGSVQYLGGVLDALLAIFVPAVIIVAIKHVFTLARN
jgi:hypothetical protein